MRDRVIGIRATVLNAYERVTFHKEAVRLDGKPPAALVAPGIRCSTPRSTSCWNAIETRSVKARYSIDTNENGMEPRLLFFLEHSITDGRKDSNKNPLTVSRQLQFVEITRTGQMVAAGYAPYLDYTPATPEQFASLKPSLNEPWLGENLEQRALSFAIQQIVPAPSR